ncbi:MAG: sensor histidine kinase [Actinobacteria bacterium ATB1]|nr:sensor histidine kinase [Actinobacteria bacterium ATB1]
MSLRLRVAGAAMGAATFVVVVAGFLVVSIFSNSFRSALDEELSRQIELVGPTAASLAQLRLRNPGLVLPDTSLQGMEVRAITDGRVMLDLGSKTAEELPLPQGVGYETIAVGGEDWRVLTELVFAWPSLSGTDQPSLVQVAAPLSTTSEEPVNALKRRLAVIGAAAIAASGGIGFLLGTVALRPLARLRRETERVTEAGDYHLRVTDDSGPLEVDQLGEALNLLLDKIVEANARTDAALEAARSFGANAAHELRTPLQSLRTNLDILDSHPDIPPEERAEILEELLVQQDRFASLLQALRELARGDLPDRAPSEQVDVHEVAEAAVVSARARFPETTFELTTAGSAARTNGWSEGLRVMVDNLIDNAVKHGHGNGSPERGQVVITVDADGEQIVLTVDDDGPGIPPGERKHVLERFARGSGAAPGGTGLGLALVAQQVRLHEGEIEITDSSLGGARIRVRLPIHL